MSKGLAVNQISQKRRGKGTEKREKKVEREK